MSDKSHKIYDKIRQSHNK